MDINIIRNNENLRQAINNGDFAQFLSENLAGNGVSQEEIDNLINIFQNQINNNQNRQSIISLYSRNSIRDSLISRLSIMNSNSSR